MPAANAKGPMTSDATFPERSAGVLLHVTSLPSPWGVGDLGATARDFAQRLGENGQRYWQTLPLNPTTIAAGESPYFSNSSQAGNPLLISLEDLCEDGLLEFSELPPATHEQAGTTDFALARRVKSTPLTVAARRLLQREDRAFDAFCDEHAHWLDDHARFNAVAAALGQRWRDWPDALKYRERAALETIEREHADQVNVEKALQFLFQRQWRALHDCCRDRGVRLFGDMPIYVNTDSADVWGAPGVFELDESLEPSLEAGVPPDYFSETGQLWRNPVYRWDALAHDNFDWWVNRLQTLLARFDVLRIDHFRGLAQFWAVAAGAEDARNGEWRDVPSTALFDRLCEAVHPLPIVAEDLGTITPDVIELRDRYAIPGMIVLQFAFGDDHHDNPYKPENHRKNAVAYLGTHDNTTCLAWLQHELDDAARHRLGAHAYAPADEHGVRAMIDLLLSSPAQTAIVCAQDLLALPASARMNVPGEESGNWCWQLTPDQFAALPLADFADRCRAFGR